MRRKPGSLIPIEVSVLASALELERRGQEEFHGYALAREMREGEAARHLTARGTLYLALERMERSGLLTSRWEDPQVALEAHRPPRRMYRITAGGRAALARAEAAARSPEMRERLAEA